jgi:hypothetical protein
MLKLFGRVLLLSLLAAFVAVLVWAGSLTPSYQKCKAEYAQSEGQNDQENSPKARYERIVGAVSVVLRCEGNFLDANSALLTAIATVAIACFTFTLKRSSDKLWAAGERQLDHLRNVSRQELRAYIGHHSAGFENQVVLAGSGSVILPNGPVKYFDWNYGRTPALDVSMFVRIVPGVAPASLDTELLPTDRQDVVQIVHPGQNIGRIVGIQRPNDAFFLYGYVDYTDIFGHRWRHRFAFHHDPARRNTGGEAWEAHRAYNDEEDLGEVT